jgi:AmmeMemoRadiSam system protein B
MSLAIRQSAVAGSWYPSQSAALAREVEGYLSDVGTLSVPGRLIALVSPHAGLFYSGPVAAYGYSLLRGGRERTVVLVGPSHRAVFSGLALWARGEWQTPLGSIPIDEDLASALLSADSTFIDAPRAHREEHCLEMQLPFLKHLIDGLRIVPIMMGTQSEHEVEALAMALPRVVGDSGALLVASSDLSHYHPAPQANALDSVVVRLVERYDPEGLMARLALSHEHACGGGPIVAVMKAARALGADRGVVLRYADSGDVGPRDKSHVVGYLSAALMASEAQ